MSPSSSRASRRNSLASEAVRLLLFMALLGVLSATTMQSRAQAGDRPTLVLGGDANFPPYEFLDANGRPAGFHVDLMRAVGDAMGFDVEVRLGPWDEVRSGLTAGEIDVVAMFESANRSEFEFTQPHDAVTHRLYVRLGEGEARPRSLGDLAGLRVIVQRDGYVHDYLKQQELDTELIFTVSETEALRRLAAGEGDVAVLSQSIGHHLADTPVMAKLTTSGPTLLEARYCFAVARGRFDLLTQIESGIEKLKVSGAYSRIERKWLATAPAGPSYLRYAAIVTGALVVVVALGLAWTWSLRRTVATRTAELQEQLVRRDASEREQARLQQQRDDLLERYRRLTDDSPDAIFVKSQDRVVYANAAAQRLLGAVSAESLSGMKFLDCIHPDDRPAVTECIEQLRRGEPAQFLEKRFLTLTGEVVDVELAGSPCMFDGNPAAQVVVRDVSARKRAERSLLQRQREQTAVAELGIHALTEDLDTFMQHLVRTLTQILSVDFVKILEYEPASGEVFLRCGGGWREGLVGELRVKADGRSQAAYTLDRKEPVIFEDLRTETRFAGPSVLHQHAIISGMSVVIPGVEQPFGVLGVDSQTKRSFSAEDTRFLQSAANVLAEAIERDRAERALRDSEQRYAMAVQATDLTLWDMDIPGDRLWVSERFAALLGYEPHELGSSGGALRQLVHPDDESAVTHAFDSHLRGQTPSYESEHRLRTKSGAYKWVLASGKVMSRDEAGRPMRAAGTFKDVDERKHAELALRQSEARLHLALEALEGGIWDWNLETGEVVYSAGWARMLGYEPQEIEPHIGSWERAVHPEDREAARHRLDAYLDGRAAVYRSEHRMRTRTGATIWVLDRGKAVAWDENGRPTRLAGTELDITKRKEAEQLLQQRHQSVQAELEKIKGELVNQTRLATIGQVSASIAHELRNPLGSIRNAQYLLKRRGAGDHDKWQQYMGIIEQEVNAAERIINDLMEMSRAKDPVKQDVNVAALVQEVFTGMVRAANIELSLHNGDGAPQSVYADGGQLRQILANLFNNAGQAMGPSGGRVHVTLARDGDFDMIEVRDEGPGIDAAVRERIFEPLFSTRAKGTGLGLAICRQIIERHGGTITLTESTEPGAAFQIRLPRVKADNRE